MNEQCSPSLFLVVDGASTLLS